MMQEYRSNSYLFGGNAPYVEEMYEAYLDNPGSVPDNWRAYFDALQNVPAADGTEARDVAHAPIVESFAQRAKANAFGNKASNVPHFPIAGDMLLSERDYNDLARRDDLLEGENGNDFMRGNAGTDSLDGGLVFERDSNWFGNGLTQHVGGVDVPTTGAAVVLISLAGLTAAILATRAGSTPGCDNSKSIARRSSLS